jgi:hypothetical protein
MTQSLKLLPADRARLGVESPLVTLLRGVIGAPPSALSCLRAFVLQQSASASVSRADSLELVSGPLPLSTYFNPHLDTTKLVLMSSLIIHTQLQHVAIVKSGGTRIRVGR